MAEESKVAPDVVAQMAEIEKLTEEILSSRSQVRRLFPSLMDRSWNMTDARL